MDIKDGNSMNGKIDRDADHEDDEVNTKDKLEQKNLNGSLNEDAGDNPGLNEDAGDNPGLNEDAGDNPGLNEDTDDNNSDEDKLTIDEEDTTVNEEYAAEIEADFRKSISLDKEEEAANEEELYIRMKKRIIRSYRWQEDIIIPFAKELKITTEELEEILMKRLDMSQFRSITTRFESSRFNCTKERIHSDLKLCWLSDVMNILTEDETEEI
jgi:energy-converting hydrogenase A subunit M